MLRRRLSRSFVPVGLSVLGLLARPALSQSYGPGDQVLVVGAAAFQPFGATNDNHRFSLDDGYLYGEGLYSAPVTLPDGAEVFMLCLYAYDPDPGASAHVLFQAIKLPAGGQSPGAVDISDFLRANFDIGYGVVCTSPFSYTFHTTEVAGGINLAHRFFAGVFGNGGLGGVGVFWRRQVSPPPGVGTFSDVSTLDAAWPYIEALYAAGITAGCQAPPSPPRYCPDAALTRRQMAVFLAKALGLHFPN